MLSCRATYSKGRRPQSNGKKGFSWPAPPNLISNFSMLWFCSFPFCVSVQLSARASEPVSHPWLFWRHKWWLWDGYWSHHQYEKRESFSFCKKSYYFQERSLKKRARPPIVQTFWAVSVWSTSTTCLTDGWPHRESLRSDKKQQQHSAWVK